MTARDFVNELGLDLAAEQVAENPDLPAELVPVAHHYRLDIIRYNPYMQEHFIFSVPAVFAHPQRPDPLDCLVFMAQTVNGYRANPEPSAWAAANGLPDLPGIHDMFHTFARDEQKLMRIMGEAMDRFLALALIRGGE